MAREQIVPFFWHPPPPPTTRHEQQALIEFALLPQMQYTLNGTHIHDNVDARASFRAIRCRRTRTDRRAGGQQLDGRTDEASQTPNSMSSCHPARCSFVIRVVCHVSGRTTCAQSVIGHRVLANLALILC